MSIKSVTERAMKRQEVILRVIEGKINWIQAATICGVSDRQMRRIKKQYETRGFSCLVDGRHGRPAWNRVPLSEVKQVQDLYREKYFDFNVQHFREKLIANHNIHRSYSWVKKILQDSGLVSKEKSRKKHRRRRERKPLIGMLLHLDGSTHAWLGSEREKWDLVLILDDANSEVYFAEFVDEEDTRSVMKAIRAVVEEKGIFCSLYTDRASHFAYTPKAGEAVDKSVRTQCQRALEQLNIELILAYSPQARGRGERLWETIQGRLPQELRFAEIATIEQANKYLKEVFIPNLNNRFMVEPKEKESAFMPVGTGVDLNRIFSIQHSRQVNNDNTISYKNLKLQIPKSSIRHHFVHCKVNVYEHLGGTISIGYGPHTIGRYDMKGMFLKDAEQKHSCEELKGRIPLGRLEGPQGTAHDDSAIASEKGLMPTTSSLPLCVNLSNKDQPTGQLSCY